MPLYSCNILSVSQLATDLQCIVQFNSSMCAIQDRMKELIGMGLSRDGFFLLLQGCTCDTCFSSCCYLRFWPLFGIGIWGTLRNVWLSYFLLFVVIRIIYIKGVKFVFMLNILETSFLQVIIELVEFLRKYMHCDLWGANRHVSSYGAHYFLIIVDDYSHDVWIYLLEYKTEFFRMFMAFVAMHGLPSILPNH